MALADEVLKRYRSRKGTDAKDGEDNKTDDSTNEDTAHDAGKALIAAIRKGDVDAVVEAVRGICE